MFGLFPKQLMADLTHAGNSSGSQAVGIACLNNRFALRVPKDDFEAVWKIVKPQAALPSAIDTDRLWKIDSLPFGITAKVLSQWADHHALSIKPIRSLGPRGWLVGATGPPPGVQFHYGQPLLIKELKSKTHQQSPIIAGPQPVLQAKDPQRPLPPLMEDPWAGKQLPRPAHAGSIAAPTPVGPTEQKFSAQENRIANLEAAMEQQAGNIETLKAEAVQRDQEMRVHLDQRLVSVKNELSTSLSSAIQMQSKTFEQNFTELKNMLAASAAMHTKRKNVPTGPEDMMD